MHSVVMAAYNCAGWISHSIEDVLKQTDPDWELIVVDDGSTDGTRKVVEEFVKKDPRISYVYRANSGSPAKPRNLGLSMAKGQWISFLDHDDRWHPERLAKVNACFRANLDADVIGHDHNTIVDGKAGKVVRSGPGSRTFYLDMLCSGNRMSTLATAMKTDVVRALGGFDERREFFTVEDYDLWLRLAEGSYRIHFLHEILGDYVTHAHNMSGDRTKHFAALESLLQFHLKKNALMLSGYRALIEANFDYIRARDAHRKGDLIPALELYRSSIRRHPRKLKPYLGYLSAKLGVRW